MRLAPEQMTSAVLPVSIKTSLKLHFLTEKLKKFNFMQVICRIVNTYNFTPETGFGSAFFFQLTHMAPFVLPNGGSVYRTNLQLSLERSGVSKLSKNVCLGTQAATVTTSILFVDCFHFWFVFFWLFGFFSNLKKGQVHRELPQRFCRAGVL